jgi:hypothetical protein
MTVGAMTGGAVTGFRRRDGGTAKVKRIFITRRSIVEVNGAMRHNPTTSGH